jgi:hypothetical protein
LADTKYFKRTNSNETGYFNSPKRDVERVIVSDGIQNVRQSEYANSATLPSFWSILRQRKLHFLLICYPEICVRFVPGLPVLWFLRSIQRQGLELSMREMFIWLKNVFNDHNQDPDHSLRKIVFNELPELANDIEATEPLRRGR